MCENKKNELETFIDDLLDDIDNPIVSETGGYGYIGFVESLIMGSINTGEDKQQLINSLEKMRKKEMDALVAWLKDNQIFRDCRDQFKQMCLNGVFKNNK